MKQTGRFTRGEELANAVSHGVGAILCLVALIFLTTSPSRDGGPWHGLSATVFGVSLLILYLSSTLNHSLPHGKTKNFFHNFDQVAIYLLIAGTYTPFALVALEGRPGWILFGAEWTLAGLGTALKLRTPNRFEKGVGVFTIATYVVMGWLFVFVIKPVLTTVPIMGLMWLFAGGAFYMGGIVFFKMTRVSYHHLIWHLFVIAGSACHFIAIFSYVLPIRP